MKIANEKANAKKLERIRDRTDTGYKTNNRNLWGKIKTKEGNRNT